MVVHTGDKKFKCDICEKSYTEKGTLTKHKQKVHEQRKNYVCPHCKKKFGWKESLDRHMKTQHSQTREIFECSECKRQFWKKEGLESHYNSMHLNNLPFECDICGKVYPSRSSLHTHKGKHGDCGTKAGLKPVPCPHCNTMYKGKGNLMKHIRLTHRKILPYTCGLCGDQFQTEDRLYSHRMSHLNKPAYLCDLCNKPYTTKFWLVEHIQKIHISSDTEDESQTL
jgi:uncharacterized Zn-finger protein